MDSQSSSSNKTKEVKDKRVKVRVTMVSGVAGRVVPEGISSRVEIERKTSPQRFVAANGQQSTDVGEKTFPSNTNERLTRCMTFRSAGVAKPFISMQKVARAGNIVVLDEQNSHIRRIRDGTMIMLDVHNGLCTMDVLNKQKTAN